MFDPKKVANPNEDYFIAQGQDRPYEDLRDEERKIIAQLGIKNVKFFPPEQNAFYSFQEEAIAVARMLIDAKPSRHLAVISRIKEARDEGENK